MWRAVHGLGVMYLLFLVGLLLQNVQDMREIMKLLFPDIVTGERDGPHITDGYDCSITWPNVYEQLTSCW